MSDTIVTEGRKPRSKYLGAAQKTVPTAPLPMEIPMSDLKELLEDLRAEVKAGRGREHRGEAGIMAKFVYLPGDGNGKPDHIQILASYG
jgi:hypothetical protein